MHNKSTHLMLCLFSNINFIKSFCPGASSSMNSTVITFPFLGWCSKVSQWSGVKVNVTAVQNVIRDTIKDLQKEIYQMEINEYACPFSIMIRNNIYAYFHQEKECTMTASSNTFPSIWISHTHTHTYIHTPMYTHTHKHILQPRNFLY
jgi:hypothetical protein